MIRTLRQKALDFLSRREHSRFELAQKLHRDESVSASEINSLLELLEAQKLLSDKRFAENYCQSRLRKGYGIARIAQELRARNVEEDTITSVLKEAITGEKREALCQQVRQKKFGEGMPATLKEKFQQMQFLAYRGFTSDEIKAVLRDLRNTPSQI